MLTTYDSSLVVIMLHINIKTYPNPNLNQNCAMVYEKHDVVPFSGRPIPK